MSINSFSKDGAFLMAALDHRGSLRRFLNSARPASVTDEDILSWKQTALKSLTPLASSILVDPEVGLAALRASKLDKTKPFLLSIEQSGYDKHSGGRFSSLAYSARELKNMGAAGIKLLIYYNPYHQPSRSHQESIIKKVSDQCRSVGLPLLLELVTYNRPGKRKQKKTLVLDSVKRITELGYPIDIYKLEFPGLVTSARGVKVGRQACRAITKLLGEIPWILLSAGRNYPVFKKQVDIATSCGADGFLAGRALWQDFVKYPKAKWPQFFQNIATKRLSEISQIARRNIKNYEAGL